MSKVKKVVLATQHNDMMNDFDSVEEEHSFIEKNLIRRLRHVWECNTEVLFFDFSSEQRFTSREYLVRCLNAAGKQYPEITWLSLVDQKSVDSLIRSIKR